MNYKGNEYHILQHTKTTNPNVTLAYRNSGNAHIELLKEVIWPEETKVHVYEFPVWLLPDILAHREYTKEMETQEDQEQFNHEREYAI